MMKNRLCNIVSPLTPRIAPSETKSTEINERKLPKHAWMFIFIYFLLLFVLGIFPGNRWRGEIILCKKYCGSTKFISFILVHDVVTRLDFRLHLGRHFCDCLEEFPPAHRCKMTLRACWGRIYWTVYWNIFYASFE